MAKLVRLTSHAKAKLIFLRNHGFPLHEEDVRQTLLAPERIGRAHGHRWVAQRRVSERHVLRVIYEESAHERVVITCYPARRSRYEPTHEV